MKAEVAKAFPMEHEDSHEDYILWLKILQKYGFACAVNEPLLRYRLSNTGKSGSKLHSAKMTFKVYRYMGFGTVSACLLFASYAFHGVMKYALSFLKK
jgi:teichuronic acid biosynthesis glycosyltransferase TuaG